MRGLPFLENSRSGCGAIPSRGNPSPFPPDEIEECQIKSELLHLKNQWPKLIRVLEDGRLRIDTNRVENAIRPFVIGRKNWILADTVHGAQASANLYSIIETTKAKTLEAIQELLPHRINCTRLKSSGKN